MVDFHDRRVDPPDFANGTGGFHLTTAGYAEHDKWQKMAPDPRTKREVHVYYKDQKPTQTWREANRLASRRTRKQVGGTAKNASDYAHHYEENLVRVMATKGPKLAKQFGEIRPGR